MSGGVCVFCLPCILLVTKVCRTAASSVTEVCEGFRWDGEPVRGQHTSCIPSSFR
jgi:hypothetical protein